ncbi:MAG: SDR family NAD(P)-dependent oxidoreductase, partial [Litorimonas sp.]
RLARYGAHVVLCARRADALHAAVAEIERSGGTADSVVLDVTDMAAVEAVMDRIRPDLLINNAGTIDPIAPLHESDPLKWAQAVQVNLLGVYAGMRFALPHMVARGSGTVVNLSSGAANSALVGWSHYCATKAAGQKLTMVSHREVSPHGVTVVGLSPGTVATPMMRTIRDSGVNPVSQLDWSVHIPPEWPAEAIAYLCGPDGARHAGTDFSIKTPEGRKAVGLPQI